MVERKEYLDELIGWKDEQVIKAVTGIHRCGKSTLLAQYQTWLKENGIADAQIVSINFEELEYEELLDYKKLYAYLKERLIPEKNTYICAFPEQEEWTISTDEGITTSNAMSTFMIQTTDGREIGFIKDNCPSDEDALTSDSGDSVIVTYVTSDNANFPLEIRKGK